MTNTTRYQPTRAAGAITGLALTVPLIALFYLSAQLLGTAFVPFDLFDWLARVLPGGVITFGIDFLVSVIAALNLEDVSRTAKTAEHILALVILVVIGMVVGAALFNYLRKRLKVDYLPGLVAGALIGVPAAIISGTFNQSADADPLVSLAWILVLFLAWGVALVWVYRQLATRVGTVEGREVIPETASVERLDRRSFLIRVGGAAAAITVVGSGVGALLGKDTLDTEAENVTPPWSAHHPLPNAEATLQPAPGTRLEFTPVQNHYRIDINALPPVIREEGWKLKVGGLVDTPLELTLQNIREDFPAVDQFVTLSCISNPVGGELIGTQRWTGVPLKRILTAAKPQEGAAYIHITAADGFDEYLDRSLANTDDRIMLAYAWDDLPLTTAHGFPLRIYIPNLYGMKQPKWITRIDLTYEADEGYWVRRGWDAVAQVRATSVIDTVAVDARYEADGQMFVPVGGIAFAGKRGISKVEVRVDGGDWNEAELRDPISDLTWVIWRYDWPFQAGDHVFSVRCVDGLGAQQIETPRGEHPSGATGIDQHRASL
jgi:DMSO/TMAO reductase YedYZ molybdopterin-dependent catalytic subunit